MKWGFIILILLASSCGLDEYFVLDEPATRIVYPTSNTTDELLKVYSFRTSQNASSGAFIYEGTAIYYRIYNNLSTLKSHSSSIDSVNTENDMDAAAKRITDTYKYLPLGTSKGNTSNVLFDEKSDNSIIEIRLHDYHEYKRHISVNGVNQGYYPMRNGDRKSFHFNPSPDNNVDVVPEKGDEDVEYGSPTKEGTWYINAYAFAKGHNAQFNDVRSLVLHLGTIIINEADFQN